MRHRLYQLAGPTTIVLSAAVLWGCNSEPRDSMVPTGPGSQLISVGTVVPEEINLCKVGTDADFTVTVTSTPGVGSPTTTTTTVSLTDGSCTRIAFKPLNGSASATVTENSAAGIQLDSITTDVLASTGGALTHSVTSGTSTVSGSISLTKGITWTFYNQPEGEDGCSFTIGYWKTHAGFTGNNPDVVTQFLPIDLGTSGGAKTLTVSTASQAVSVLSFFGNASNGINKLYAQLLGAKLNIANGADGSAIASTISAADAFLATHDSADWSSLTKAEKQQVLAWMETLDDYNNGLIGPGHCP